MHELAQLAGFFAAHGIWCVSDGETLIPMVGCEFADGDRQMNRFLVDDLGEAARAAEEELLAGHPDWVRAVLVADAYVSLDTGQTDALIVDAVGYGSERQTMRVAVPYRPLASALGFAVHRPVFFEVVGADGVDHDALTDAFFAGVDSHEEAAEVWNAHLDTSV